MKRAGILLLLLALVFPVLAQEASSTLKVQGVSKLTVKPTRTVVSFNIRSVQPTYAGSVQELIRRVDLLSEVLKNLEFPEDEIITSTFSVRPHTYFDRGTRRDSGYVATQTIRVELDQDQDRLLQLLNKATASKADPAISLEFSLSRQEQAGLQNELIRLAVEDAHKKAALICEASGYQIHGIEEIQYGLGHRVMPEIFSIIEEEAVMAGDVNLEFGHFEPSGLTFRDSVLIHFLIGHKKK